MDLDEILEYVLELKIKKIWNSLIKKWMFMNFLTLKFSQLNQNFSTEHAHHFFAASLILEKVSSTFQ